MAVCETVHGFLSPSLHFGALLARLFDCPITLLTLQGGVFSLFLSSCRVQILTTIRCFWLLQTATLCLRRGRQLTCPILPQMVFISQAQTD